jgi:hypothetical protein
LHFLTSDSIFFCRSNFRDYKIIYVVTAKAGGIVAITSLLTVFNLRGTSAHLQIGVSIGVRGRRVRGPIFALRCPKWAPAGGAAAAAPEGVPSQVLRHLHLPSRGRR